MAVTMSSIGSLKLAIIPSLRSTNSRMNAQKSLKNTFSPRMNVPCCSPPRSSLLTLQKPLHNWSSFDTKPEQRAWPTDISSPRRKLAYETYNWVGDDVMKTICRSPTVPSPKESLVGKWREYHGAQNWEGLLDPLDQNLRREIVKYGEFAQATYDSFDFDPRSNSYGHCTCHDINSFFDNAGLKNSGYKVTKYLYATSSVHFPSWLTQLSNNKQTSWMGFVAVSDDAQEIKRLGRRDIVISWRGTMTPLEWAENIRTQLTPLNFSQHKSSHHARTPKVENGFLSLYTSKPSDGMNTSASEQIMEEVQRLVELYKDEELSVTITGHSLGASLALLSAYQIGEFLSSNNLHSPSNNNNNHNNIPVTVFSFGGPRVGNHDFNTRMEEIGVKALRIVNRHDLIPRIPGIVFNEWVHRKCSEGLKEVVQRMPWTYTHVGTELRIDHLDSPYLKLNADVSCCHNLEAHLHLVDGFESSNSPFRSNAKRDYALVNKTCNQQMKKMTSLYITTCDFSHYYC